MILLRAGVAQVRGRGRHWGTGRAKGNGRGEGKGRGRVRSSGGALQGLHPSHDKAQQDNSDRAHHSHGDRVHPGGAVRWSRGGSIVLCNGGGQQWGSGAPPPATVLEAQGGEGKEEGGEEGVRRRGRGRGRGKGEWWDVPLHDTRQGEEGERGSASDWNTRGSGGAGTGNGGGPKGAAVGSQRPSGEPPNVWDRKPEIKASREENEGLILRKRLHLIHWSHRALGTFRPNLSLHLTPPLPPFWPLCSRRDLLDIVRKHSYNLLETEAADPFPGRGAHAQGLRRRWTPSTGSRCWTSTSCGQASLWPHTLPLPPLHTLTTPTLTLTHDPTPRLPCGRPTAPPAPRPGVAQSSSSLCAGARACCDPRACFYGPPQGATTPGAPHEPPRTPEWRVSVGGWGPWGWGWGLGLGFSLGGLGGGGKGEGAGGGWGWGRGERQRAAGFARKWEGSLERAVGDRRTRRRLAQLLYPQPHLRHPLHAHPRRVLGRRPSSRTAGIPAKTSVPPSSRSRAGSSRPPPGP